jgi:hypothetical protein
MNHLDNIYSEDRFSVKDNKSVKQHSLVIEFLLLPWIIIWGWYLFFGVAIFIFANRENRFSANFSLINYQFDPNVIYRVYWITLFFSFCSFVLSFFLGKTHFKIKFLYFILNLFILINLTLYYTPLILSIFA